MSVIRKMRKQKAVWWERSLVPDEYGKFTFLPPVEIDCRWDDVDMVQTDPKGEVSTTQATVYPDREMKAGDRLKKGAMESGALDDPLEEANTFEIVRFDQIPNFRATETLYIAFLFNYGRRQ